MKDGCTSYWCAKYTPPRWTTTHSTATHGHSPQAHTLATDFTALSFDLSAWLTEVNCKPVGPDDAWTEVPRHHPSSHPVVHSSSVATVETSNSFLPLYSLMVEDYEDEDEDPNESPTASPSLSVESTKPDPQSTKATSTSSPSTKPPSTYTLYGMQDCPIH